jgi:hypothetical protein
MGVLVGLSAIAALVFFFFAAAAVAAAVRRRKARAGEQASDYWRNLLEQDLRCVQPFTAPCGPAWVPRHVSSRRG